MTPGGTRAVPGQRISLILALAVHGLLAVLLVYGVHWQTRAPDAVEVELVRAATPPTPTPVAVSPAPTSTPSAEPNVEPAPKPIPKADIPVKDPKVKPPPKEITKAPPKVVTKEVAKEAPRPDPFQEQLKKESDRLDKSKLAAALDKEVANARAAQTASAQKKATDEWLGRIRGKIRGNIVLPPELKGNPEAVFDVAQLPSGEILSVKLKKTSGIAALDAAIERAILKSSPLPKPEQAELSRRDLELRFRPLED